MDKGPGPAPGHDTNKEKLERAEHELQVMHRLYAISPMVAVCTAVTGGVLLATLTASAPNGPTPEVVTGTLFLSLALFALAAIMAWTRRTLPKQIQITLTAIGRWRSGASFAYDRGPLRTLQLGLVTGGGALIVVALVMLRTAGGLVLDPLVMLAIGMAMVAAGLWVSISTAAHPGYRS